MFLTKVGPGGSGSQSGGNLRLGYGAVDSSLYRLDVSGNMHITGVLVVDGSIDLNNQIIHDVASPIDGSDATNKNYVDTAITKTIGLTLNGNGAVLTSGSKGFKEIDNNLALNLLVQGVNKGQRHGVYTLNDASLISKVINFLLNLYQQQPLQSIPEEPEEQLQQEPLQEPLQQEPELDDNFDLNELSQPIPLKKSSLRVI